MRFVSNRKLQDHIDVLVTQIFTMIFSFCQIGYTYMAEFCSPKHRAKELILSIFDYVSAQEKHLNTFVSLLLNSQSSVRVAPQKESIVNTTALQILFTLSARSHFSGVVYEYLQRLISLSLENRWSCYNSGFLLNLIEGIDESYPQIFFSIIQSIGSDFCGPKEFERIIQKLMKTDCPYSLKLLDICLGMAKGKMTCKSSQGIHVETDSNVYYSTSFERFNHFKLSFSVTFEKLDEHPIFVISSPHETITISSGALLSVEYIRRPQFTQAVAWSHPKRLKPKRCYTIEFSYTPSSMALSVKQIAFEYKLDESFEITASPVVIDLACKAEKWLSVESISITEIPPDSLIGNFAVPYPFGFSDVLPIAGGAKCLLPFLDKLENSVDPQAYLSRILELISFMLESDPGIDKLFIRSLSHLLRMIKQEYWTEKAMALLGTMANRIKDQQLHQCYLYNILVSFDLWISYPLEMRRIIFVQNIEEAYKGNQTLFRGSITFAELMTRYYMYSTSFTECPIMTKAIRTFLMAFPKEMLTEDDAYLIIAFFFQTKDMIFADISGQIIYNMLAQGNSSLESVIMQNKGYIPFVRLAGSVSETVMNWALHIIFVLFKATASSQSDTFQICVLEMITMFSRKMRILSVVSLFLGFILDSIYKNDDNNPVASIDRGNTHPLVFVEYTPLFAVLLGQAAREDIQVYLTTFLKSIQLYEESRNSIVRLKNWYFWLTYLGIRYNYLEEVMNMIGFVASETMKKDQSNFRIMDYYDFFFAVFSLYDLEWERYIPCFLCVLVDKVVPNSVLKYILMFIHIHIQFVENRRAGQDLDVMSFYADLFVAKHSIDAQFTLRQDASSLDPRTGLLLVQTAVATILGDPSALSDSVQLGPGIEFPRIVILGVILGFMANLDADLCDSAINDLMGILKKMEFSLAVKNAALYIYGIPSLSEASKATMLRFLKEKLLPADAQKIDELVTGVKTTIRENLEGLMTVVIEELGTRNKSFVEMGEWLSHMLHLDDIVDLSLNTEASLGQNIQTRKANDALNVKQNEKSWMSLETFLEEGGGVWSTLVVPDHWEVSSIVDAEGRKYLMKINRHFNDHKDAALKRDAQKVTETRPPTVVPVSTPRMKSENETASFDCEARYVTVKAIYEGKLQVFNGSLAFESHKLTTWCTPTPTDANKLEEIDLCDILFILKRRYLHQDNACELFTKNRRSYFFVFLGGERDWFLKSLARQKSQSFYIQTDTPAKVLKDFDIVRLWQVGKMSNYEYLYWLNMIGGRSFHDLSQYPVFPWVIKQYTEPVLNLDDPETYRDLSQPVGALNPQRLEELKSLFGEMDGDPLRCHYRVFYTSPATVVNYLIRCEPFTTCHIDLQSGAFDHATRIVTSIPATWKSVTSTRPDFRELIPEFYTLPSMLVNSNKFDLGLENSDMELPPWCSGPDEFIFLNRVALESKIVTQSLNGWVDLIFGYKSRGKEAVQAFNDFHPFSYPECITNRAQFGDMGNMIEDHAATFGVVPQQIFSEASPKKAVRNVSTPETNVLALTLAQGKVTRFIGKTSKGMVVVLQNELYLTSLKDREFKVVQKLEALPRFSVYFAVNSLIEQAFDTDMVVAVAPVASSFALFDLSSKVTLVEAGSRHPGPVQAVAVDTYTEIPTRNLFITVATVSRDASFFIWRARIHEGKCSDIRKLSSMEHRVRILDISVSMKTDIVATVDESPQLVLTRLSTGQFYRSLALTRVPFQVEMGSHGHIILFSRKSEPEGFTIDVLNLDCQIVCSKDYAGETAAICLLNPDAIDPTIVIAFRNRVLQTIRMFRLTDISSIELPGVPVSVYAERPSTLWIAYEDGSVSQLRL